MKHLNITITGNVQGVHFRDGTKAVADQLSLAGFVKNIQDGSVYIEVEGDIQMLDEFIEWCQEGPERAEVKNVELQEGELRNFSNFIIKR
jgi:acylphosphatase